MEVGQAVLSLDFVDAEFDLAEGVVFVILEIGEGDFEDAAFEGVVGGFETGGAVYEGLADTIVVVSIALFLLFDIPLRCGVLCGCGNLDILSCIEGRGSLD